MHEAKKQKENVIYNHNFVEKFDFIAQENGRNSGLC